MKTGQRRYGQNAATFWYFCWCNLQNFCDEVTWQLLSIFFLVLRAVIFVLLVLFQVSIQVGTSSSSSSSSSFILTRKHMALQGRRERKIACKKASEFYGDINSEYYWLHFSARPIANETESDQVPSPAWNVCNLTLHKTSNSVPHPAIYTVNPEGDSSTARIFISGRLVRNPPDYQPGPQSTQVAFPGRVLHIKRPAVEDEGLWICCTNENEEAMEAFDVTVSGVPANRSKYSLLTLCICIHPLRGARWPHGA